MVVLGCNVKVGDVLHHANDQRIGMVASLKPYAGSLIGILGEGTQIATFSDFLSGRATTLPASNLYKIGVKND